MYTDDDIEEDESGENAEDTPSSTLRILSPSGYIPESTFLVSGYGARPGSNTIYIVDVKNADNNLGISRDINDDGTWTATATMRDEADLTYYAAQKTNGLSPTKTVVRRPTTLTKPQPSELVGPTQVVFGGICFPGELPTDPGMRIRVLDGTTELASVIAVGPATTWEATSTLILPGKVHTVRAEYKVASSPVLSHTNYLTFEVIGLLTITAPTADQDMRFTVYGTGGKQGASVKVRLDRADTVVGQGTVGANGTWSASVQVSEAGTVSLVAEQNYQNVPSGPGLPQAFRVRPPRLTAVTVTTPTATSVKFEGSGYTGATVQISVVNGPGGGTPPAAPVNGGRWETTVTNWPFGLYNLSAIQKVSDDAGGWIESQPYTFNVDLKLPGPSDVTYTDVYQPTFSGKGLNGATVRLFDAVDDSKIAPDAPVDNRGEWSTRALAEWGPTFKRRVKVLQFWDEQASPDAIEIEVTIPPVAPVMNPPVENGLSPNLSGTCWPEAELKLTFSDSAIEHIVDNHNGSWSFRRDEPFAPEITHTASLTQFAAQQTSLPAIKTFVVALPMRKPVLTYPEPNDEVGRNVTIRGRDGMAGATMQLRDAQFDRPLGQAKLLTADGEWFIELADLAFRRYTIDAQQTLEGRPSEYSEHLAFEVVLLPPEFDEPQPGGSLPRTSELSGRGMRGGLVDVWLQGASEPLLKDVFIDSDGHWKAKVTLPVGETTIRAVQRFEDQVSKESPWLTYDVVPAAPFIETPAADEHIGRRVVVSGFGVPGDSVTVKLGDAGRTVLGSSPVLEDRTWSLTVTFDQPGGAFGLMAVASSEGFDSADSPARAVVLGTYQPSIEVPAAGRWVGNPVRFEGQGRAGIGYVVSWFNPDRVWAPDLSVASGGWQGAAPQALPDGGNWCRFRQSITDAVDGATTSDWVESERFEILSPPARLAIDAR